jgi:predicted phage-related endonuclease
VLTTLCTGKLIYMFERSLWKERVRTTHFMMEMGKYTINKYEIRKKETTDWIKKMLKLLNYGFAVNIRVCSKILDSSHVSILV